MFLIPADVYVSGAVCNGFKLSCFLWCVSPPQSSHAVHSHTASWILLKLLLQQTQPIINQLTRGRGSIIKRPVLKEKAEQLQSFCCFWCRCRVCACVYLVCVCVYLVCAHHHINAIFLQWRFIISDVTDSNNCGGTVALQVLRETTGV